MFSYNVFGRKGIYFLRIMQYLQLVIFPYLAFFSREKRGSLQILLYFCIDFL